jgi:xanthine dehydrogenase accessory factor
MRDVLRDLDRWQRDGEAIALATLVAVHGSAPRVPGARLLVTASGKMSGSVSGGCVESDIVTRAQSVLAGGVPVLASYGIADDSDLAVGLTCAEIEVLIAPFRAAAAWDAVRRDVEANAETALALAIAPAAFAGRMLAVGAGDVVTGSIAAERDAAIVAAARHRQDEGGTEVVVLGDGGEALRVFVEAFPPPVRLVISGGSHVAVVLARLAKQVGMHVTVIDARSAYLGRERFPDADALVHASPGPTLAGLDLDGACVVSLTHDLKFDVPALAAALRSEAVYVGAMGSRRTHERRVAELRELGFTDEALGRIHTPIGLDLGATTPEEIAIAILAEVLAVRTGRDGAPLRDRAAVDAGRPRRAAGFLAS